MALHTALDEAGCYDFDLSKGEENVPIEIDTSGVDKDGFPKFQYTPENVPGPGCSSDPAEITLPGCRCHLPSCESQTCQCLQRYGPAYCDQYRRLASRDAAGDEGEGSGGYSRPVFECNALCDCGEDCSNRVVQRGVWLRLRVFLTPNRGWGVRTAEAVPRGAFVCEYAGEVIGQEEARRRQLSQGPADMNYIIAVREFAGQGICVTETFVDPATRGNVGRFINHSCQPNLIMVPVRVHSLVPRLALFAARDIAADEELTFDYSGRWNNRSLEMVPLDESQVAVQGDPGWGKGHPQRKACYCGAPNCSGYLPLDITVLHG